MTAPRRRITATITLEETIDDDRSYPSYHELVETKITISLPVPNEAGLPYYLSQQISGFLEIATQGASEPDSEPEPSYASYEEATNDELNAELDPDVDRRAVPA